MLVILPFEEELYRKAGVDVEFVGHPLIDLVRATKSKGEFCADHGIDARKPILAMLPAAGARKYDSFCQHSVLAAKLISEKKPDMQLILPVAAGLDRRFVSTWRALKSR